MRTFFSTTTVCLLCLLAFSVLFAGESQATIYTYVDESGVMHFTNVPTDSRFVPFIGPDKRDDTRRYSRLIKEAGRTYRIDPAMITSIITVESNFDRFAVSPKGAQGLMQLMPGTASDLRVRDPFDPEENIFGGTRYFSALLDRFDDDVRLALAAYNAGPERVKQYGGVPPIRETRKYIDKVLATYHRLKGLGESLALR